MVLEIPPAELSHRSQALQFCLIIEVTKIRSLSETNFFFLCCDLTRNKNSSREKQIKIILL